LARLACVMRAASVNPEPGSNSPSKTETQGFIPESSRLSESFPLFSCQSAGPSRPGFLPPFQGARNLPVGGTGELYRAEGWLCKGAGRGPHEISAKPPISWGYKD